MSNINGGVYLINSLVTPVPHTGDTNRFLFYSFPLKGGTLGANDGIQFTTFYTCTSSVNNKTFEIDFGSTNIFQLTVTNSVINMRVTYLFNQNSLSAQRVTRLSGLQDFSISSTLNTVSTSENTANDLTIGFYGTLANTGETISLVSMYAQAIKTTSLLT